MLLLTRDHHRAAAPSPVGPAAGGRAREARTAGEGGEGGEGVERPLRESKFLPTSTMYRLFADGCGAPPTGARVVYVDGGWDMFHAGRDVAEIWPRYGRDTPEQPRCSRDATLPSSSLRSSLPLPPFPAPAAEACQGRPGCLLSPCGCTQARRFPARGGGAGRAPPRPSPSPSFPPPPRRRPRAGQSDTLRRGTPLALP